jgi:predicted nucleic acid-binding protein
MSGTSQAVYWDTCVFLAWIKGESRSPEEESGIRQCVDEAKAGHVLIVTSDITRVEVLDCRFDTAEQSKAFASFLHRPEVGCLPVDNRVALLAHEIRDYYQQCAAQNEDRTLRTPDAIHLATAIHYEAYEMHTFDNGKRDSKSLGLLGLSGDVAGRHLTICKPRSAQLRMDV